MLFPEQNQRKLGYALSLNKGQDFEELIQCSEPAGHKYKTDAVFYEANLARKKVMKIDRDIGKPVASLFMRKLNVKPHRLSFYRVSAAVGGFHDSRAATSDDGQVVFSQPLRQLDCRLIIGVVGFHSCGAKDRHSGPNLGQNFERINELGHDPKNSPGIFLDKGIACVVVHLRAQLRQVRFWIQDRGDVRDVTAKYA